jgi:hypothetical protein
LTIAGAALKKNAGPAMTFDVTCQSCDASFETELSELIEDPKLECPHCEARAPKAAVEAVTNALDELFAQLAILRRKFTVILEIESDDLPPPHDRDDRRAAAAVPDEDEDEEDDEEDEDDEDWDHGAAAEIDGDDEDR